MIIGYNMNDLHSFSYSSHPQYYDRKACGIHRPSYLKMRDNNNLTSVSYSMFLLLLEVFRQRTMQEWGKWRGVSWGLSVTLIINFELSTILIASFIEWIWVSITTRDSLGLCPLESLIMSSCWIWILRFSTVFVRRANLWAISTIFWITSREYEKRDGKEYKEFLHKVYSYEILTMN